MFFHALNKALERPAPDRIPLGLPMALKNDFYAVTLEDRSSETRIYLQKREGDTYFALTWRRNQPKREETLSKGDIEQFQLRIEHYYQGYQFDYTSPLKFIVFTRLRWHRLVKFRDKVSQSIYNKKSLLREERMELLHYLVERKIENPRDAIFPLMFAVQRYSRKWLYHPDKDKHQAHLQLVLDSFVASGELEKQGSNYVVTPKALASLSDYELNLQRHQDQINTAKVGNKLTRAIIIVGLIGVAFDAYVGLLNR